MSDYSSLSKDAIYKLIAKNERAKIRVFNKDELLRKELKKKILKDYNPKITKDEFPENLHPLYDMCIEYISLTKQNIIDRNTNQKIVEEILFQIFGDNIRWVLQ